MKSFLRITQLLLTLLRVLPVTMLSRLYMRSRGVLGRERFAIGIISESFTLTHLQAEQKRSLGSDLTAFCSRRSKTFSLKAIAATGGRLANRRFML